MERARGDDAPVGLRSHFFFFQAEDGIRDYKVTGVQTCALPICDVDPAYRRSGIRWPTCRYAGSTSPAGLRPRSRRGRRPAAALAGGRVRRSPARPRTGGWWGAAPPPPPGRGSFFSPPPPRPSLRPPPPAP